MGTAGCSALGTSIGKIPLAQRGKFADEVRSAITAVAPSGHLVETVAVRAIIAST
jgi:hypothetical protein